ncbi:TonB-dependent receptor [Sphingobium sp. 15-1]|uniref:TonB-dependent receptor n=1 Tax=Sphingobium sp. 15-1 TaxID=2729616 RepID=UPI00159C991E|nr:TonB-dependent receptor [Sphingobium sp. 15-1]
MATSAAMLVLAGSGTTGEALAQITMPQDFALDIPAGSLQSALTIFGRQTGLQLIYAPEAVSGRQVERLRGRFTPRDALQRLISGTGLRIRAVGAKVIVLEGPSSSHVGGEARPSNVVPGTAEARRPSPASDGADGAGRPASLPEIIVTGSNIRGQAPVGSSVRTISRAQMEENGYRSVAQALQALPGNFGGVANEQASLSFVDRTGTNATLSSGVNLRGLGAAATLVLVNGRRLAGAGNLGDFADVSNIPMSVVDRIEVLMDGASAIYGSDAVGGVVNIIMKDRFEGLESGARFGTVTKGGMHEFQAYQTVGTEWGTGGALLSYEYYDRRPLMARDRRFSRTADSRPLGGTDHRNIYSLPGNILGFDPVTGGLGALYAIPGGQNGTALGPEDFLAGEANAGDPLAGAQLIPAQTRHSIYAAANQDLGGGIHLSLEGRFTRRDFEALGGGYITILTVTPNNPWFVSPTGQSADLIGYDFGTEIGASRDGGWSQSLGLTGALDIDLGGDWKLATYAAYARSKERHLTDQIANEALLAEALGTIGDDPATAYSPSRDGYFNPYGDGSANSPAVLAAVGSGFLDARNVMHVATGNLQADGTLTDLPAGPLGIALGANVRRELFRSDYTSFYATGTPSVDDPIRHARTIFAAFAEARIPIFGEQNARPGLRRLDLSIAGRIERYPDFGTTANPKFGLNWSPLKGLAIRGTYGTSFRAPNLAQLRDRVSTVFTNLVNARGAAVPILFLGGGNPDLEPERARSWTVGADLEPSAVPGLRINGTLFRTIFDRRIDRPAARDLRNALINPDLAPFVRHVSPTTNTADRDYVLALVERFGGAGTTFPVDRIAAVVDARYVNTASTDVRGLDMAIGYTARHGRNSFSIDANASYLLAWRQRTTPTSVRIDQRNLSGQPVDFRGRLSASWRRDAFDALVGVNYVDHYRSAVTGIPIHSWTTVDARLAWTAPSDSSVKGLTVALAAQNLFDRDPPFYDSSSGVGYDAANSDATGRFVSLQITKRW